MRVQLMTEQEPSSQATLQIFIKIQSLISRGDHQYHNRKIGSKLLHWHLLREVSDFSMQHKSVLELCNIDFHQISCSLWMTLQPLL